MCKRDDFDIGWKIVSSEETAKHTQFILQSLWQSKKDTIIRDLAIVNPLHQITRQYTITSTKAAQIAHAEQMVIGKESKLQAFF